MIVKNEEKMLPACLESIKDAEEIVIVDTGSTDKTLEVIKAWDNGHTIVRVFTDYKWNDNFAEARNHSLKKCTGDWILTIDADDALHPGGMEKIRAVIDKYPNEYCFNVLYRTSGGLRSHSIPVLYKNCKKVFWKGAIHNFLSCAANYDSGAIIKYGHSPAHSNDPDRAFRILKKEVDKDPKAPRNAYYLAREYMYRKDWVTCLYWADEHLKRGKWALELSDAHLMKGRALWHLQRGEEARDACLQAIKINTNFREALLFMSEMTGPVNKDKWLFMAEMADNTKLLFVRGKIEKPASYYEAIYKKYPDVKRYDAIYETVGRMVGKKTMLDIGCGQAKLSEYIKNYDGFDMAKNPYKVADIYTHEYGDYAAYVLLEVLEHLARDTEVLDKIPVGKEVIFSVPSFDDPAHVRVFTEDIVRWRYRDLINFRNINRFNFDKKTQAWKTDAPATPSYILLCRGQRI